MLLDRKADEIIDTSDLPYNKTRRAFAENEVAKRAAEKKASMDAESEKYKRYLVTEKWLSMKNKVMKRDAYLCQCCLSAEATICHHKTYERKYNEAAFDLVAVCFYCHEKIHGNA
jgi:5-methylcytosine-specific restriction endonuclease McrA